MACNSIRINARFLRTRWKSDGSRNVEDRARPFQGVLC